MGATIFFLGCFLVPAQPPGTTIPAGPSGRGRDWAVGVRLGQAQELHYRGTYAEESLGGRVQFTRNYRLESRVFVLESTPRGAEVALLTVVKAKEARASQDAGPGAVRLEKALIEPNGRLTAELGHSLAVPLDGPPSCECGMVVDIPRGRLAQGQGWETAESGRPMRLWRVIGSEMVNGTSCVKLVVTQQTEDWDHPRLERAAWRREDTIWIAVRSGLAARVERVIHRREAGHSEPSMRAVLRYELDTSLQYPGQLFDERRQEVIQAWTLAENARPLLLAPTRNGPELIALLAKINFHLDKLTPTPYREAVLQVKRQVEAGRRGETPPPVPGASNAAAEVGQLAPDFIASYLTHAGPAFQLHRWLGRPMVFAFYQPTSPTAPAVLEFAQKLAVESASNVVVLGLAVGSDPQRVRKQWSELHLTLPILGGGGLRGSYAVETTPKFVVLDASGVVRGTYLGWGSETAREVQSELRQWLPR